MAIQNTDKFLVNRSKQSYQVEQQNLMAKLKDSDLMLVNRNNQSFAATGADIKSSFQPAEEAPVLTAVMVFEENANSSPRFTEQKFQVVTTLENDGNPASSKTFTAWVEGTIDGNESTTKYLQFDSAGNVTDLVDAAPDPAVSIGGTNPGFTLTFPATFPSGNAPDDELGDNVTLTVSCTASNSLGSETKTSVPVQPKDGGGSGPGVPFAITFAAIAGGGKGGGYYCGGNIGGNYGGGGGGGAGGYLSSYEEDTPDVFILPGVDISVTVGTGGGSSQGDGTDTLFSTEGTATTPSWSFRCIGGGRGGAGGNSGASGGCGGGGGTTINNSKDFPYQGGPQSSEAEQNNNIGFRGSSGGQCPPQNVANCNQFGEGFWCNCKAPSGDGTGGPGPGGGGGGIAGGGEGPVGGAGKTLNFSGTDSLWGKGGNYEGETPNGYGHGATGLGENNYKDGAILFVVDSAYVLTGDFGISTESGSYDGKNWFLITGGSGNVKFEAQSRLSAEEFEQQKLKFETYKNRVDVKEGKEAAENLTKYTEEQLSAAGLK